MPMSQWARQKLTRSWWLFSELLGRVDAWNAAGEFTAEVHVLPDRTALEFLTPAGFRPPVSEWALLVGDAVHNARSALIWAWVCQVCRGERTPCPSASASARSGRVRWWRACRVRRVVTLICAGWIPHDGLFGGAFTRV